MDQLFLLQYGAMAGILAKTMTAPFDRLTKLKQTGAVTQEMRLLQVCRSIKETEGVVGFWKGNWANCLRAAPQKGILFLCNDLYLLYFEKAGIKHTWLSGGLAGCTSTLLTYPLDTVQVLKAGVRGADSHSLMQKALLCVREKGVARGLFPGLGITLLGTAPYYSIKFTVYDLLQGTLLGARGREGRDLVCGPTQKVACGAVASIVGNLVMYPNNIVRRTMQAQGHGVEQYNTIWQCYTGIYRKHGLTAFYRGLGVNLVRVAPNTGIQFWVYESLKELHFKKGEER